MNAQREKAINLPGVVTALIAILVAIQCLVEFGPEWLSDGLYEWFAFVPARLAFLFDPAAVLRHYDGFDELSPAMRRQAMFVLDARPAAVLSLLGYAFLHANWTHLFVNVLTLAAFGAPVARRFRPAPFLAFLAACAVAGALTHLAVHPFDFTPVVGASAAISGTMAAIARFAFTTRARGRTSFDAQSEADDAAAPLSRLGENRQAMLFLALWFGVNVFFGVFPQAIGASGPIAWEAHLGGFLFGLISFGAFERAARWRRT